MELQARKSKIHLTLLLLSFGWAVVALIFSSVPYIFKVAIFLILLVLVFTQIQRWIRSTERVSLRGRQLYVHNSNSGAERIELSNTSAHLYWIKLKTGSFRPSVYLFRDSFTRPDWRALLRAIHSG